MGTIQCWRQLATTIPNIPWITSLGIAMDEISPTVPPPHQCKTYSWRPLHSNPPMYPRLIHHGSPKQVNHINYCRLYLNVLMVSDIAEASGTHLDTAMLHGQQSLQSSTSRVPGCIQLCPGPRQWALWRKECRRFSLPDGSLLQPLGSWSTPTAQLRHNWKFYHDT